MIAVRLCIFCETEGLLPKGECGFRSRRSTMGMMSAMRRLQALERNAKVPLFLCFVDLEKECDSADRTLLWQVLARF